MKRHSPSILIDANQNHKEVSLHLPSGSCYQTDRTQQLLGTPWSWNPCDPVAGNVKRCKLCANSIAVPREINNGTADVTQWAYLSVCTSKIIIEAGSQKISAHSHSRTRGLSSQWDIILPWKEGDPVTCSCTDAPWGQYAGWKNPVPRGQTLHDSTHRRELKQSRSSELESGKVITRGWGEGGMRRGGLMGKFRFCKTKKVVGCCTIMCIHFTLWNGALKNHQDGKFHIMCVVFFYN